MLPSLLLSVVLLSSGVVVVVVLFVLVDVVCCLSLVFGVSCWWLSLMLMLCVAVVLSIIFCLGYVGCCWFLCRCPCLGCCCVFASVGGHDVVVPILVVIRVWCRVLVLVGVPRVVLRSLALLSWYFLSLALFLLPFA